MANRGSGGGVLVTVEECAADERLRGVASTALALADLRAELSGLGYSQPLNFPEHTDEGDLWVDRGIKLAKQAREALMAVDVACLVRAIPKAFGVDVSVADLDGGVEAVAIARPGSAFIVASRTVNWRRQRLAIARALGVLLVTQGKDLVYIDELRNSGPCAEEILVAEAFSAALLDDGGELAEACGHVSSLLAVPPMLLVSDAWSAVTSGVLSIGVYADLLGVQLEKFISDME